MILSPQTTKTRLSSSLNTWVNSFSQTFRSPHLPKSKIPASIAKPANFRRAGVLEHVLLQPNPWWQISRSCQPGASFFMEYMPSIPPKAKSDGYSDDLTLKSFHPFPVLVTFLTDDAQRCFGEFFGGDEALSFSGNADVAGIGMVFSLC